MRIENILLFIGKPQNFNLTKINNFTVCKRAFSCSFIAKFVTKSMRIITP